MSELDWEKFGIQFNLTDITIKHMKTMIDLPIDFVYLSDKEIGSFYKEGFVTLSTINKIMGWLNNWERINVKLGLTDEEIFILKKDYEYPSDISSLSIYDDNFDIPPLKKCTAKRIVKVCEELFDHSFEYRRNDLRQIEYIIRPLGFEYYQKSCGFSGPCKIIKGISIVDENIYKGFHYTTLKELLENIKECTHLVLDIGYISDLTPLIDQLNSFENLKFINLSVNRLGQDQLENIFTLAKKCVVKVDGNPCITSDSKEIFGKMVDNDLSTALNIIFIPNLE